MINAKNVFSNPQRANGTRQKLQKLPSAEVPRLF
jgi:hypothetical protein